VSGQLHAPAALLPGKEPRYPCIYIYIYPCMPVGIKSRYNMAMLRIKINVCTAHVSCLGLPAKPCWTIAFNGNVSAAGIRGKANTQCCLLGAVLSVFQGTHL
jgi:hypothetical protein